MIHIRCQVKRRQSQSYKVLKITNNSNFETHLLELLDKMCRYEMDTTRTVRATERTRDTGQTDGRTDRRTDGRTEWNQYTPYNFVVRGGIMNEYTLFYFILVERVTLPHWRMLSVTYRLTRHIPPMARGHFQKPQTRALLLAWCWNGPSH